MKAYDLLMIEAICGIFSQAKTDCAALRAVALAEVEAGGRIGLWQEAFINVVDSDVS